MMAFVYKYENKDTHDVEYVGISRNYETLVRRIIAHKRDEWWEPCKYHIFYFETPTQCDAEMLEAHFIDLYQSYDFYNKAKSNWGKCTYAPTYVEWKEYDETKGIKARKGLSDVEVRERELKSEASLLWNEVKKLDDKYRWLYDQIYSLSKETAALKRRSVRQWFRENYELYYGLRPERYMKSTAEELFNLYDNYLDNYDEDEYRYTDRLSYSDLYDFQDSSEFWDTMLDIKEFRPFICGEYMTYALKAEEV